MVARSSSNSVQAFTLSARADRSGWVEGEQARLAKRHRERGSDRITASSRPPRAFVVVRSTQRDFSRLVT
jgi:hypothetical protein